MTPCKLTILDSANCVWSGLAPGHLDYFFEEYSAFSTGYRFNPKYKLGSWDGKIRFFRRTGKTYVNLLPDMIPRVIGLKYKIQVVDKRKRHDHTEVPEVTKDFFGPNILNPDTEEPWEIRDYQLSMINALIDSGGGVGIAGTGGGKTSIVAAMVLAYERSNNLRSIIIVPDKSLTLQTFTEYQFFGLDVGEYSGTTKDTSHQHVVSTWQALQHNPTVLSEFDVVVVDECHGARGTVIQKLLNEHGMHIPFRFGVTGTLPKEKVDQMAVRITLGDVEYEIPAHELIAKGFLAKMHIDVMQVKANLHSEYDDYSDAHIAARIPEKLMTYVQFKNSFFPDWPSEKHYFQSNPERLEWIAEHLMLKQQSGNVFCLTVGVPFGKRLAKLIPDAVYLYGNDPVEERQQVYELFKTHDNMIVIANAKIASTGLNIKRIFNMVFIDIGKSFITTIQGIGRGLRKASDKDSVLITDICCDLYYSKRHMRDRMQYYNEAKYPYTKKVVDCA